MPEMITHLFTSSLEERELYDAERLDLHKDPLKAFYLYGGGVFYTMHELIAALTDMNDDVFAHHVSTEKNDFANWVRGVYHLPRLADRMGYFKNKRGLKQFLKTYFEAKPDAPLARNDETPFAAQAQAASAPAAAQATRSQAAPEPAPVPAALVTPATIPEAASSPQSSAPVQPPHLLSEDEAATILHDVKVRAGKPFIDLTPPEVDDRLDKLRDRYIALKKEMSERRKLGFDLFFSTLLIKRIEPQLKITRVTWEEKDFEKLERFVRESEQEYAQESGTDTATLKDEVQRLAEDLIAHTVMPRTIDEARAAKKAEDDAAAAQKTTKEEQAGQEGQAAAQGPAEPAPTPQSGAQRGVSPGAQGAGVAT